MVFSDHEADYYLEILLMPYTNRITSAVRLKLPLQMPGIHYLRTAMV